VARRKIDSGSGGVEGLQAAPGTNHESNKVFQDGAVPPQVGRSSHSLFSLFFRTPRIPALSPPSLRKNLTLYARRLLFGVVCVIVYVLLDRSTVYLQIWPGISAWYPPSGVAVAFFVGLGLETFPVLLVGGYIAGYINYHQSVTGLPFLLLNPMIPCLYAMASLYLRRKLKGNYRIRSVHDVTSLLGVSLLASLVVAVSGTAILVHNGEIPALDYAQAAFNWWIGLGAARKHSNTPGSWLHWPS
jgi:hypothetical protein